MCGIGGIVGEQFHEYLEAMATRIAHRGPDSSGLARFPGASFCHQRLAIQDTSESASQPMTTDDGRYTIIFNGEIYNHADLRATLLSERAFRSSGDTETLLYGFALLGEEILQYLNGIFAFAIYDRDKEEVFLARDQFGVKPLYYCRQGRNLIFASELKAILAIPAIDRSLDERALLDYLTLLWSPGEKTPLRHIRKLEPGHFMRISCSRAFDIVTKRYYRAPFDEPLFEATEGELIDALDEQLRRAVERQLLSDVPLGFLLSGGLDSSAVAAMARTLCPHRELHCYTIKTAAGQSFEGFSNDIEYARKVSQHLNLTLVEVEAESDLLADFDRVVYHLDEPQGDAAPLHVRNVCRLARQSGVKVLLSGVAADDIFSGYRRHQALRFDTVLDLIPRRLRGYLANSFSETESASPSIRRLKKIIEGAAYDGWRRHAHYFSWLNLERARELFGTDARAELGDYDPADVFRRILDEVPIALAPLNRMLLWELRSFLPDHNLNYTDKLSMAEGVEVRVPYLDCELVRFCSRLPLHLKMNRTVTKYLLRKVMERYLPREVIYRPKTGFAAPVRSWIDGPLRARLSRVPEGAICKKLKILNGDTILSLAERTHQRKIDASYTLWSVLAIDSWVSQFLEW